MLQGMTEGSMPSTSTRPPAQDDATRRFAALVEAHADFVWRSVRRLGVPEAYADDATQQVFLVAQKRFDAIEPGREKAFLFGVSTNVAAHARRSFARRREALDKPDEDTMVDHAPLPDVALDAERARVLLDHVLGALPMDLRAVLVLAELEEMTMADIADVLSLPPGTVASRLRRARQAFQEEANRVRQRLERPSARKLFVATLASPSSTMEVSR
jgi:RNA polymerase sigma-70 factor, ECF subfamily